MVDGLKRWLWRAGAAALAAGALLAPACSSSSNGASSCNNSPWQCGTGTTCWPQCECPSGQSCSLANCSLQFSCITSGSLTEGQACSLTVGSGKALCADGLTCVSFQDAGAGSCRPFCDEHQGCGAGETCVELSVTAGASSANEHVCVPPAILLDSGLMLSDASAGGSSSGTMSGDAPATYATDAAADGGNMMQK